MEDETLVVIDNDAGTDDAMAIFMAIAAHKDPKNKFRILGLTCVNGNTTVDNVCVNVTRTLKAADALDIPIYRGCEGPMTVPYKLDQHVLPYHGYDGFGDCGLTPEQPKVEAEHAVLALIRLAKEYSGRLSILAVGPLTNLAMAVKLEPKVMRECVKEVYIMGGNIEGVGNTTVLSEFNFRVDPEAAIVTLTDYTCPIVITPWEICKRQNHKEFRLNVLAKVDSPQAELLNKIEHQNVQKIRWSPCDALATAVLIEPKVIVEAKELHVTVELSGNHSRGLMIVDHESHLGQRENAKVIYATDCELYKKMLLWGLGGPRYE